MWIGVGIGIDWMELPPALFVIWCNSDNNDNNNTLTASDKGSQN